MKTKFLTALLCIMPLLAYAQNYEQQGDELFAQAQYAKALKKYSAAIEMSGATSSLKTKKEKCSKCASLLSRAKAAEESASTPTGYENAGKLYSDLFAIHALQIYKNKATALKQKADILVEKHRQEKEAIAAAAAAAAEEAAEAERQRQIKLFSSPNAFKDRKDITHIIIPNGVTKIEANSFANCTALTSVEIPNSVTCIDKSAFSGCSSLVSVTIPNSVTSIGEAAFYKCSGLTSVTIPNSVTSIGVQAFSYCTGLTSVTIPNSVTSIGGGAFADCTGLTSIVVENGNIVYDSRNNCNAIIETATNKLVSGCKNTVIPNSVTSIGGRAFCGCSGLTSVTIHNSVTSIEYGAFYRCRGLTSITIPNSVTSIGRVAFCGCSGLTSVTIHNSVTSIEYGAFDGVPNIVYFGSASGSPWGARSVNGYVDGYLVYSDGTKTTLLGCSSAVTGEVVIPNSVTSIGNYAFEGCSSLTSIEIPNSVTSIGYRAFYGCSGLKLKLPVKFYRELDLKDCKEVIYY